MSSKEMLLEVAEKLPPDATMMDAISDMEFRQAVEQGLAELDRGGAAPLRRSNPGSPNGLARNHRSVRAGCRADALRRTMGD